MEDIDAVRHMRAAELAMPRGGGRRNLCVRGPQISQHSLIEGEVGAEGGPPHALTRPQEKMLINVVVFPCKFCME